MVVQVAEIYFNDEPSSRDTNTPKLNEELITFIKRNIKNIIIKGQIKFRFYAVRKDQLADTRKKGIERFPAMVISHESPVISVPSIIARIQKAIKTSKTVAAPKSEEEVLSEYFTKTLDVKFDSEEKKFEMRDDDQEENFDPSSQIQDALSKRSEAGMAQSGDTNGDKMKKPKNKYAPPPPKPSRETVQDYDEETRPPPIVQRPGQKPRLDNVVAGDPFDALSKTTGGNSQDDMMMRALLNNMET